MTKCLLPLILALPLLMLAGARAQAETPLERGNYLLKSIVACGNCHTPQGPNGPLPGMALAGGLRFEEPPFTAIAPTSPPTPTPASAAGPTHNWSPPSVKAAGPMAA